MIDTFASLREEVLEPSHSFTQSGQLTRSTLYLTPHLSLKCYYREHRSRNRPSSVAFVNQANERADNLANECFVCGFKRDAYDDLDITHAPSFDAHSFDHHNSKYRAPPLNAMLVGVSNGVADEQCADESSLRAQSY